VLPFSAVASHGRPLPVPRPATPRPPAAPINARAKRLPTATSARRRVASAATDTTSWVRRRRGSGSTGS